LCNKIKSSESTFWVNAHGCSIEFVDEKKAKAVTVQEAPAAPVNLQTHVILQGVSNDASEEDTSIIAKALVSAYNDANWASNYHISGVEVPFKATIPLGSGAYCKLCLVSINSFRLY
jgi:hypothetical protein